MARKQKAAFTMESNLDKIIAKIEEKPFKVMNIIGSKLVKEVRATTIKSQFHQRRSILSKTLGFWARKQERDIQIGFKMSIPGIVDKMITGKEADPIKPVVAKNAEMIKELIGKALDEIRREK